MDRDRVFERFIRLDAGRARSADGGGSGLGLPIARGLARAMHGELSLVPRAELSDTELPGACFLLVLRAADTPLAWSEVLPSIKDEAPDHAQRVSR